MRTTIRLAADRPPPTTFLRTYGAAPLAGIRITAPGGLDVRVQSDNVSQLAGWATALSQAADRLAAAQVNQAPERRRLSMVGELVEQIVDAVDPPTLPRWRWAGPFSWQS